MIFVSTPFNYLTTPMNIKRHRDVVVKPKRKMLAPCNFLVPTINMLEVDGTFTSVFLQDGVRVATTSGTSSLSINGMIHPFTSINLSWLAMGISMTNHAVSGYELRHPNSKDVLRVVSGERIEYIRPRGKVIINLRTLRMFHQPNGQDRLVINELPLSTTGELKLLELLNSCV